MDLVCDSKYCTGCGLCSIKCPKGCITMQPRDMGHLHPIIDKSKCINCGICKKICPSLNPISKTYPSTAYAAWAKDKNEYKSSTSGGVASLLSQYIIKKGGIVYGCSIEKNLKIKHIRIDDKAELYKLKGSKYVQSSITEILPLIQKDIEQNKLVLFIGTPCQISAIKYLFKEHPSNLFTVDIICHGTPSNIFLEWYLLKYKHINKAKITNITFRSTNAYKISVFSRNQIIYQTANLWSNRFEDIYTNAFFDGYSIRESCHNCLYAQPNRCSDITLGDFWGLKTNSIPDDHPYGVSLILPSSKRGEFLIQEIFNELNIYERSIEEAVDGNEQLRVPKKSTLRIKLFKALWNRLPTPFWYYILTFDKLILFRSKKIIKQILHKH